LRFGRAVAGDASLTAGVSLIGVSSSSDASAIAGVSVVSLSAIIGVGSGVGSAFTGSAFTGSAAATISAAWASLSAGCETGASGATGAAASVITTASSIGDGADDFFRFFPMIALHHPMTTSTMSCSTIAFRGNVTNTISPKSRGREARCVLALNHR